MQTMQAKITYWVEQNIRTYAGGIDSSVEVVQHDYNPRAGTWYVQDNWDTLLVIGYQFREKGVTVRITGPLADTAPEGVRRRPYAQRNTGTSSYRFERDMLYEAADQVGWLFDLLRALITPWRDARRAAEAAECEPYQHTGMEVHDGYAPHSHEVRPDHDGVSMTGAQPVDNAGDGS